MKILVPLHVSGFWHPVKGPSPLYTGSIGAGINLNLYLEAGIQEANPHLEFNGKIIELDHYDYIVSKTGTRIGVTAKAPFELGKGFGLSAALSLAISLLIAHRVNGYTLEKAARLAHEAEVMYSTGLGDVIAEYYGGLEIRVKPGPPGIGAVEKIPVKENIKLLVASLPGLEYTPQMLSRISADVYNMSYKMVFQLLDNPSVEKFFEYANTFTRKVFEYTFVDEILSVYKNKIIGYYRKKQALIVWIEREWLEEVSEYLRSKNIYPYITTIDMMGTRIVYS